MKSGRIDLVAAAMALAMYVWGALVIFKIAEIEQTTVNGMVLFLFAAHLMSRARE